MRVRTRRKKSRYSVMPYLLFTEEAPPFYSVALLASLLVKIKGVEHVTEYLRFSSGDSNTLAHLLVVGRPGTKIVNRLSLVPADKVKLLVPAVIALAYDAYLVYNNILDFRHF